MLHLFRRDRAMNPAVRNLARKILSEEAGQGGKPSDRLAHILNRLRQASGFNVRQPVLLREDEDGLFALLPEERIKDTYSLCTCWHLNDEEACAAYPGRSIAFSTEALGDDARKLLNFLRSKGYTNLWLTVRLTKAMYTKRTSS